MLKSKIVVWHNLNKNTFYAKAVHGIYCNYQVGYINQYNHKIVFIYDIPYTSRQKKLYLI